MLKDYHLDPLSQLGFTHVLLPPHTPPDTFPVMRNTRHLFFVLLCVTLTSCLNKKPSAEIDLASQNRMLAEGKVSDAVAFADRFCSSPKSENSLVVRCLLNKSKAQRLLLDLTGAGQTLASLEPSKLDKHLLPEYLMEKTLVEFEAGQSPQFLKTFERLKDSSPKGSRLHNAVKIVSIYLLADQMTPEEKLKVIEDVENNWKEILDSKHESLFAWIHLSRARIYRRQKKWEKARNEVEMAMEKANLSSPDLGVDQLKILFEKLAIFHLKKEQKKKQLVLKSTSEFLEKAQLPSTYSEILKFFELDEEQFLAKISTGTFKSPPGPNHFLSEILDSIKKIRRQQESE